MSTTSHVAIPGTSLTRWPALRLSKPWQLLLVFAVLATLALTLPWFVPVRPMRSASYMYGFSNTALWALLLVAVIAPTFFLGRASRGLFPTSVHPASSLIRPPSLERWKSCARGSYIVFALLLLACAYNIAGFMEAEYFLSRIALLKAGKTPYLDFEFAYGLLLLYAPLALQWIGLPPSFGFVLLVLAQSAIGYLALKAILDRLFPRDAARLVLFSMVLATAPSLLMAGENYTFFRFAVAPLLACMLIERLPSRWRAARATAVGPAFVLAWLISPEIAIATACALTATFVVLSPGKRDMAATAFVSIASVLACAAATPLLIPSYNTLFEFGGGGHNLPAFPGPHILLAVLTIFLATLQVASRPLREQPIDLFIFLFSVALIPGMFGRCDAVHVVFYGFGFAALAAKYCALRRVQWLRLKTFAVAYVAIFMASWVAVHAHFTVNKYSVVVSRSALAALQMAEPLFGPYSKEFQGLTASFRQVDSWNADVLSVNPGKLIMLPPRSDTPEIGRSSLYFVGLENAFSPGAFDALRDAVRGRELLLWPGMLSIYCERVQPESNTVLFLFPTGLFAVKHNANEPARNFCAQLQEAPVVAWHGRFVHLDIPK